MKEKICVLVKTYPNVSKKYDHLVCVGGFTDKWEWRRIYPIPWKIFWNNNSFKKKQWRVFELKDDKPSDHRPESRKFISSDFSKEASFKEIHAFLESEKTSLEELQLKGHKEKSMGVIKPYEILDFIEEKNPHYEKNISKQQQKTLQGSSAVKIDILPKQYSYIFKCCKDCPKQHKLICEDWELGQLYRNCEIARKIGKYKDEKEVFQKIKLKFLNQLSKKKDLYFIVGTHYRFNTYMIVSVVYPKKTDKY